MSMTPTPENLRFIVERPHAHDCTQPLINYPKARGLADFEYLDSLGRRHPHAWRRWERWICNNPFCEASVLIENGSLGEMLRTLTEAQS